LFGALCAYRAVGAAIIMPATNTEAMNEHLRKSVSVLRSHPGRMPFWCATAQVGTSAAAN
jgi:type III secretory pathway component EscT